VTTKTTVHLSLPRARWIELSPIAAAAICVFCLLAIAGLIGRIRSAPQVTPEPVIIIATAGAIVPTAAPQVQQVVYAQQPAAPAPRFVVGFDSPNGHALGAIPAPEASAIVARFGDEWLQTTHDGAPIWIRASELGMNLANLAPAPAAPQPAVVYVPVSAPASPPAAPADDPVYRTDSAPQAATELVSAPAVAPQTAYPTIAPMEMNEINQNWAAEQWRAEHP
jgi:hypothetical protein